MSAEKNDVIKRDIAFTNRTVTKIWGELPTPNNPYLAEDCLCHGYDLIGLTEGRSFIDTLFLLFQGELPSPEQAKLLEMTMIAFCNPGPRHPATRAAMNAGVGKTSPAHILPIGLNVLGGEHLGGQEVEEAIRFFRKNSGNIPDEIATALLAKNRPDEGDFHLVPGFGSRFGGVDPLPKKVANILAAHNGAGRALHWGEIFAETLKPHNMGWLSTGVVAAVLCDLGFHPQTGAGLFQLICAPGILAHGLEMANKPITAMPFLDEEHYVIEPQTQKR